MASRVILQQRSCAVVIQDGPLPTLRQPFSLHSPSALNVMPSQRSVYSISVEFSVVAIRAEILLLCPVALLHICFRLSIFPVLASILSRHIMYCTGSLTLFLRLPVCLSVSLSLSLSPSLSLSLSLFLYPSPVHNRRLLQE